MLKKVILKNYRCYEYHEVDFKSITIIVGKNNAGKSTLIEALRLLSLVTNKFQNTPYKKAPSWLEDLPVGVGVNITLDKLNFSFKNIISHYQNPPAIIEAIFVGGEKVCIYINDNGEVFATVFNAKGQLIINKTSAQAVELIGIDILPQISPLLEEEKALDKDYVKANLHSTLTSRHFRNQISYLFEYYDKFKALSESTWSGLRIVEFQKASKNLSGTIDPYLLVQESNYTSEIGFMGHGLQMWLQTMWFAARVPEHSSIVLDEPDVYMHADLQRRLIRTLKNSFKQIIIATHSLEIMSEVDYESILVIDRHTEKSLFASDFTSIQGFIYNSIGSIHNLGLSRLWNAKKILIVEGLEAPLLKKVQDKLFPNSKEPFDNMPILDIGGWGGWNYALGTKLTLKNVMGNAIKVYCIFDSDYHLQPEIDTRYEKAKKEKINLHIWERKEFENYFIIPSVLLRIIKKYNKKGITSITLIDLESKITAICNNFKQDIEDDYSSEIMKFYRNSNQITDFIDDSVLSYETKNSNKLARKIVSKKWKSPINTISGKTLIKEINKWLNEEFKISINIINEVIKEMEVDEIPEEMRIIISKIENSEDFL